METRNYLREWRQKVGLTQKQVCDRLSAFDDPQLPTTEATLSRIETGKGQYSERVIEALADIYSCEPWELLGRDPFKEGKVYDLIARMNEKQMRQAEAVLQALIDSDGTNG